MIGISQRSHATITIRRKGGASLDMFNASDVTVATVPITTRSRRCFMLMQEDYIQLEFTLGDAVHFAIGDYFDDEIFGRFLLTEDQMPKYDPTTGGYGYSLKFEKSYMEWKNLLHTLTIVNAASSNAVVTTISGNTTYIVASSDEGVFTRKEAKWKLTDRLQVHAQQLLCNLKGIYPGLDYIVAIHSSAEKADEVKCVLYDGIKMIAALNKIAEQWECEWWVTEGDAVTVNGVEHSNVIHFGKCELSNTPLDFIVGDTVEKMDVSRDQQTYANRIYAYGGTENIPEDYDKHLVFTVDDAVKPSGASSFVCRDTHRELSLDMIPDEVDGSSTLVENSMSTWSSIIDNANPLNATIKSNAVSPDTYHISGLIDLSLRLSGSSTYPQSITFKAMIGNVVVGTQTVTAYSTETLDDTVRVWICRFNITYPTYQVSERKQIEIKVTATANSSQVIGGTYALSCSPSLTAKGTAATAGKRLEIEWEDTTYQAVLNPYHRVKGEADYSYIGQIKRSNNTYIYSDGFDVDEEFTIPPKWLDLMQVPYSYYTPDLDGGVLSKLGERRLHLGTSNRYVQSSGLNHYTKLVEIAVVFEKIFPRLLLKVGAVTKEQKTQETVHDDGSVSRQNWTQYKFTAAKTDGSAFPFNTKYIMDGNKLRACFTAPSTMGASGYKLAGMSFDVGFDNDKQVYTIIRNEDYGATIPNEFLCPSQGDEFFLTGWNPKAISDLGLVTAAQSELLTAAMNYLNAIEEGQFTFKCQMMSDNFYDWAWGGRGTVDGKKTFGLPEAGSKVTITHAALPSGIKTSRIIGYEYKLDIPYDTPTYTVGETDAYSRLKKIEKELTKLT